MNSQDPKNLADLRKSLPPDSYHVCVEGGTEAPFSGKYVDLKEDGMYHCMVCGTPLFSSQTKYNSGTGWPSFYDVAAAGKIKLVPDNTLGMSRTEVRCSNCNSHLGHVFNDGPSDKTGLRYCINSAALNFQPNPSN